MVQVRDFRADDAATIRSMMQRLAQQRKESTHHLVLKGEFERFFPAYLQSFLNNPDSVMKIAESEGKVVGYAIATRARQAAFYKYQHVAQVTDIFVEESARGKGAGHGLLEALEAWAKKSKLQALEVDVFPEHSEEIKSLEGLGFIRSRIKFLRPIEGRKVAVR